MAYGEKFNLEFSDVLGNFRRLSILKKDYTGPVFDLVGTGDPVIIKWDSDDDIYNPIIGSTCEINLFVTDSTNYDDWFDADEREYKIQISTGSPFGAKVWDLQDDIYSEANFFWNEGEQGYEFYWEGFLVSDRYQEAVLSKPYPIRLVASDGLGLLKGFDAPPSNIELSFGTGDPLSFEQQSNFDNLFYYIIEILKLTGLDFDIRVSNNLRKSNFNANDTLFHEIDAYEFGVLGNNFRPLNAKKLLEKILQYTNSRIFQSNGSWYIISNSNIVDSRLLDPLASKPSAENIEIATRQNTDSQSTDFVGSDPQNLSLTFSVPSQSIVGSVAATSTSFVYTPANNMIGEDSFTYVANNGTNDSDPATVKVYVFEEPTFLTQSFSTSDIYIGISIMDAISSAVNRSITNRTFVRVIAQKNPSTYINDVEWFQVGHSVASDTIEVITRDFDLNGFFAIKSVEPYQNLFGSNNDPRYALALNIRDGLVVERFQFEENFKGVTFD